MSIKPINLKRKKDGGRNSEAAGIDAPLANPHIYGKKIKWLRSGSQELLINNSAVLFLREREKEIGNEK